MAENESGKVETILWDCKTAAKYLGISYWCLRDMANRGEIKHSRPGNLYRFRKEVLDNWIAEQEEMSVKAKDERFKAVSGSSQYGEIRKIKA